MSHTPSIFNDVLGPVMRGPSSSHSAAALRIGRMCRDLMKGDPGRVVVTYDSQDALATTHRSQGSDMGLKAGLLGCEADDPMLLDPDKHLDAAGITLIIEIKDTGYDQPNLYLLELKNQVDRIQVAAVSTGGGMVELIQIDGNSLSIRGGYHEILIWSGKYAFLDSLSKVAYWADRIIYHKGENSFLEIKSDHPPESAWIKEIENDPNVDSVRLITPVLPILHRKEAELPFETCAEMFNFNEKHNWFAWELAAHYESILGRISRMEVVERMENLYEVMRNAVDNGLKGTSYDDRLLGPQSGGYINSKNAGILAGGEAIHNIVLFVSATMETKSSMGTIVAAPTAGACGTLPGAVIGVADSIGSGKDDIVRALLAGSLVGIFIASSSTFLAEIGGCQAECGSASGMAAAAIASLLGGSPEQCMAAASMALQNSLGMICDPIAARVEAPCLGKNITSATNALTSANMIMAGYNHLIPLDEVIETMDRVGKSLPRELRCTALGGLSVTPAAKELEKRLKK